MPRLGSARPPAAAPAAAAASPAPPAPAPPLITLDARALLLLMLLLISVLAGVVVLLVRRRSSASSSVLFRGRVVLVTGATGGLGRALCRELLTRGARVAAVDLVPPAASTGDALVALWGDEARDSARLRFFACDVTRDDQVRATVRAVREHFAQPVYGLVNNAGVVNGQGILDAPVERIRRTLDVNCMAHVLFVKELVPEMIASGSGMVITLSSILSHGVLPRCADYCASKAACSAIHDGLRQELRLLRPRPDVHMLLVCPYWVDTGMFTGVSVSVIGRLLLRQLSAAYVARATVDAAERRRHVINLPAHLYWIAVVRSMLPIALQDLASRIIGADRAMDGFAQTRAAQWTARS